MTELVPSMTEIIPFICFILFYFEYVEQYLPISKERVYFLVYLLLLSVLEGPMDKKRLN